MLSLFDSTVMSPGATDFDTVDTAEVVCSATWVPSASAIDGTMDTAIAIDTKTDSALCLILAPSIYFSILA